LLYGLGGAASSAIVSGAKSSSKALIAITTNSKASAPQNSHRKPLQNHRQIVGNLWNLLDEALVRNIIILVSK